MIEGSSTGCHARDAVTPTGGVDGSTPPVSPSPHPVNKGMIESKRPVTSAVHSGMRAVFVALALGEKHCCLVKSRMYCSIETGMVALI